MRRRALSLACSALLSGARGRAQQTAMTLMTRSKPEKSSLSYVSNATPLTRAWIKSRCSSLDNKSRAHAIPRRARRRRAAMAIITYLAAQVTFEIKCRPLPRKKDLAAGKRGSWLFTVKEMVAMRPKAFTGRRPTADRGLPRSVIPNRIARRDDPSSFREVKDALQDYRRNAILLNTGTSRGTRGAAQTRERVLTLSQNTKPAHPHYDLRWSAAGVLNRGPPQDQGRSRRQATRRRGGRPPVDYATFEGSSGGDMCGRGILWEQGTYTQAS